MRKKLFYTLPLIPLCLLAILQIVPCFCGGKWMFARGESVHFHIALITPFAGELKKNEYVVFTWHGLDPQSQGLQDGMKLVKRAGCLPKEKIYVAENEAKCAEVSFLPMPHANSKGDAVYPKKMSGIIPDKFFFAVGDVPHSYDSRYFGLIPIKQVTHRVIFKI